MGGVSIRISIKVPSFQIYIYIFGLYIYIYIYIERERERERRDSKYDMVSLLLEHFRNMQSLKITHPRA